MKKIPIGGELRPLHFGMTALAEWCELTNSKLNDLSKLGDEMGLQDAIQLIYVGLKHGARMENREFKYTYEKVGDWIDVEGMQVFTEAMEAFTDQMAKVSNEKKQKGTQKK